MLSENTEDTIETYFHLPQKNKNKKFIKTKMLVSYFIIFICIKIYYESHDQIQYDINILKTNIISTM